jgi:DUF971 family protein
MTDPSTPAPMPTSLRRLEDGRIEIAWSDGVCRVHSPQELRNACPCATCRERRTAEPQQQSMLRVLSLEETEPLLVTGMKPVGQYAYSIDFSDGHGTGIYLFEYLRELGREGQAGAAPPA